MRGTSHKTPQNKCNFLHLIHQKPTAICNQLQLSTQFQQQKQERNFTAMNIEPSYTQCSDVELTGPTPQASCHTTRIDSEGTWYIHTAYLKATSINRIGYGPYIINKHGVHEHVTQICETSDLWWQFTNKTMNKQRKRHNWSYYEWL